MEKKTTVKKLTLAAVLSSLGVIFLFLGSVVDVADLSAAAAASFIVVIAVIELGGFYKYGMYFVVSVLSMLLLPNKMPAALFVFFTGYYPIAKAYFEKHHYIIAWILKISLFNVFFTAMVFITMRFFVNEEITLFSFKFLTFLVANSVFILYDIAMSKIIIFYLVKLRKLLRLKNY